MNDILSVEETEIILHGFETIHDTAYFILRKNGVFIVSDAEEITAKTIKCQVINRKVFDENLISELRKRGFDSNLFGKIHEEYYCENPN
ncbi:hypothetical protein [Lacrimispora amygdalina]|uniref:hypothetical protein n=1 Tax=Lacrimispora amygdalina TaxID=253257 RepID=UPI000BE399B5|nr:hypothetical protein [Lacrimispora amygdalina]